MLSIRSNFFIIFGIIGFMMFYVGLLNYMISEQYTSNLDFNIQAVIDLENAQKIILQHYEINKIIDDAVINPENFSVDYYTYQREINDNLLNSLLDDETNLVIVKKIIDENRNLKFIESDMIKKISDSDIGSVTKLIRSDAYNAKKKSFENLLENYYDVKQQYVNLKINQSQEQLVKAKDNGVILLVFVSVISLGMLLGSLFFSKEVSKSVIRLQKAMSNFTSKEKVDEEVFPNTSIKEFNELYHNFQTMSNRVEDVIVLEKKINEEFRFNEIQKNEFIAMISHELKTPLVPIKGYIHLLQQKKIGSLTDEQTNAINEINISLLRLEKLILDILTAQKLEMAQMKYTKTEFIVSEFMADLAKHFKIFIAEKNISLINSCKLKTKVFTDRDRLNQVFSNLITNSIDFVSENGTIELGAIEKGNEIIFYVKDNGVGIPDDVTDRIFEKFYQVDSSHRRSHGGTGLGLSICRGIVEGLGGRIWVESKLHKGTTIFFSIPLTDS